MADIRSQRIGDICSVDYGNAGCPWDAAVAGENAILDHACTLGEIALKDFAATNLDCLGDGSGQLTVTPATTCTIAGDIAGLEKLIDTGVTKLIVTGSGATTLNQPYVCAGCTEFTGSVTGGGPALAGIGAAGIGITVMGLLTAMTITGTSDNNDGVCNSGTITGDIVATSNSYDGICNGGPIVADNITAQSTSRWAFSDDFGTLTEGAGAAGVNLTVRRLDGGVAVKLGDTTISDILHITFDGAADPGLLAGAVTGNIDLKTAGIVFATGASLTGDQTCNAGGNVVALGADGAIVGSFNADGNAVAWTGTGTLDCNQTQPLDLGPTGATGLDVTVSANTTTLGAALRAKSLDVTGGTLTTANYAVNVQNLTRNAGATYNLGTSVFTSTGTGTWTWYGDSLPHARLGGVEGTYAGHVVTSWTIFADKYTFGVGSGGIAVSILTGNYLRLNATAANSWNQPTGAGKVVGAGTGHVDVYAYVNATIGRMDISLDTGAVTFITIFAGEVITQGGDWLLGTGPVVLQEFTADQSNTITLAGYRTVMGATTIRKAVINSITTFNLGSGIVSLGGLKRTAEFTGPQVLNLNTAHIETTGRIDGAGITVTADADNTVHITGIGAPTVQNFEPDHVVHCHGCTEGAGNNANVTFDEYAAPGSLALCGVGI